MTSKFCPSCGSQETKNNPLINELCKKCFSKQNPLLIKYKEPKIIICSCCNSYLYKNKWYPKISKNVTKNIRKIINKTIRKKLEFNKEANIKLKISPKFPKKYHYKQGNVLKLNIKLRIKGRIKKQKFTETRELPLTILFSICNLCKRAKSSYYEAILQLRPKNKKILKFIEEITKNKKNVFITKKESFKYGYDLYLTSQEFAKRLAYVLKKKFNGILKISHKLYGRKNGRNLYRATVLFRLKD